VPIEKIAHLVTENTVNILREKRLSAADSVGPAESLFYVIPVYIIPVLCSWL
jgi:hypothetical protein